tara:strand:+ start:136 stop:447 length:312 start_codon:yes stop_codon:yes gene_type:complete
MGCRVAHPVLNTLAVVTQIPNTIFDRTDVLVIIFRVLQRTTWGTGYIFQPADYNMPIGTVIGYQHHVHRLSWSLCATGQYQNGQKKNPVHVCIIHDQDLMVKY